MHPLLRGRMPCLTATCRSGPCPRNCAQGALLHWNGAGGSGYRGQGPFEVRRNAVVGWVERSDTHHHGSMGFAGSTHPAKRASARVVPTGTCRAAWLMRRANNAPRYPPLNGDPRRRQGWPGRRPPCPRNRAQGALLHWNGAGGSGYRGQGPLEVRRNAVVGWVERSDTHHHGSMGFAGSTHPTKSASARSARQLSLLGRDEVLFVGEGLARDGYNSGVQVSASSAVRPASL